MQKIVLLFFIFHTIIFAPSDQILKSICKRMSSWPVPYKYVSPVYAIIADQTSEMKNHLLFGESENSFKQLLKLLFHVTIGNEFRITAHEPYVHFTPKTMIILIKAMLKLGEKKEVGNLDVRIEEIRSTFKGNKNPSRLKKLFQLMDQSIAQEENKQLRKHVTLHALILFLYLKATTDQELLEYEHEMTQLMDSAIPHLLQESIFDQELVDQVFQRLQSYNDANKFTGPVPFLRTLSYKNNPCIADCTEAVLLDLVRLVHAHRPIEQSNETIADKFFATYSLATCQQDLRARKKWLSLCCDQADISYRKNKYEVNPNIKNIVILLRRLCGLPDSSPEAVTDWCAKFKTLCSELSSRTYSIECQRLCAKSDSKADIKLQLKKIINNEASHLTLYVHIRNDHTWISRCRHEQYDCIPVMHTMVTQKDIENSWYFAWLYSKEILEQLQPLSVFKKNQSKSEKNQSNYIIKSFKELISKDMIKQLFFTFPTDSDEQLYQLNNHLLHTYYSTHDEWLKSIATKSIDAIADSHFIYKSLLTIANFGFHNEFKHSIVKKFPELESDEQDDIIQSLVYHKADKDSDYAKLWYK